MWAILENAPCAFEQKMYMSAFGWNVLKISIRTIWPNVSFKACVFLFIFSVDNLSIGVGGGVKVTHRYGVTVAFPF